LWIDAICINQGDHAEKDIQSQSMAKIYGYAKCTIVWLGEEADGSDLALETIRTAGLEPEPILKGERYEDEQAVTSLLQRLWFQRIWVKQKNQSSAA
jgi:hypothetical protein